MDGKGSVQTNSPTCPTTSRPASSKARTALPSARHCISPARTGIIGLPQTNAPARSVPPEIGASQTSRFTAP